MFIFSYKNVHIYKIICIFARTKYNFVEYEEEPFDLCHSICIPFDGGFWIAFSLSEIRASYAVEFVA